MMKRDRGEEGWDRDGAEEAAGEDKEAREECEAPERSMRDGTA